MVFRGEIHCHSVVSDGSLEPRLVVELAVRRGARVVSVTDHDTFRGSLMALRGAALLGLRDVVVLCGNEVRTVWGDVLVLCSSCPGVGEAPRDPFELREFSDSHGCLMVAAHPYHLGRKSVGSKIRSHAQLFDAVEVWNSRGFPLLNVPAILDARSLGMPATSGSDAHVPSEIAVSPIVFLEEPYSSDQALELVRRGLVAPTIALPPPKSFIESLSWAIIRRTARESSGKQGAL
ncbi:MAG: PHP domain-containing protein [Desulfurococcales archaeon]|nr:PHP domain-containing protein [Desulfurococcales archaeon]